MKAIYIYDGLTTRVPVASTGNGSRTTSLTAGNSKSTCATTQVETPDVNAEKHVVDSTSNQDTKQTESWRNKPRIRAPWINQEITRDGKVIQFLVRQPEHHVAKIVTIDFEDRSKLTYPIRIQGDHAYNRGVNEPVAHRILGIPPDSSLKYVIDHINGDHLDNRKSNLRIVPFRDNVRNKTHYALNHTGIIGLSKGTFTVKNSPNVYMRYVATVTDPNSEIDPKTQKGKRYTRAVSYGINRTEEEARQIALDWLRKKQKELGYDKFACVRPNDYLDMRVESSDSKREASCKKDGDIV